MINFLSTKFLLKLEKILIPITNLLIPIILSITLYIALIASPIDYQQGEMVRIMYVHVPAAWMALGIYSFITICSLSHLIWKTKLSYIFAVAAAPIGGLFALITLITGSLWGYPIWGTWWVWDARLTSMLVLLLQYIAYIAIVNSASNIMRAEKPAAMFAIIGFINIPIVKFSVDIWYSLHQPSSFLRLKGIAIHQSMLKPLLLMFVCFILYFGLILLLRSRTILNQQKSRNHYDLYSN
ncbi:MAG: heme ABC transporter permease [Rickettsiaceae bacterium]|nr:heme ABC transporter permease [Rickettsiaceae bacterium]